MALYIRDDEVAQLVTDLATRRGTTIQEAVRIAVLAALDRDPLPMTVMDRLEKLWAEHPLPAPTGEANDKTFFDELPGDL